MADPDSFYGAAEKRIEWLTLALGFSGVLIAAVKWGWRPGVGVALGGLLTWLNFRWLKQGVAALVRLSTAQSDSDHGRVPVSVYLKFFGRFGLLLLVVYVILSRSLLPAAAVLAGLFAVVGAVLIEVVFQLFHGKREPEIHT